MATPYRWWDVCNVDLVFQDYVDRSLGRAGESNAIETLGNGWGYMKGDLPPLCPHTVIGDIRGRGNPRSIRLSLQTNSCGNCRIAVTTCCVKELHGTSSRRQPNKRSLEYLNMQ